MSATLPVCRWATTGDAAALARVHAACFEEAWSAEACGTLIEMPGVFGLLAEEVGSFDGFILCRVVADEAEVLTLAVIPRLRRRGLGRLLLLEAMGVARTLGARTLFLEVGEPNIAARKLYENSGLKVSGRRRNYYRVVGREAVDALTMAGGL